MAAFRKTWLALYFLFWAALYCNIMTRSAMQDLGCSPILLCTSLDYRTFRTPKYFPLKYHFSSPEK